MRIKLGSRGGYGIFHSNWKRWWYMEDAVCVQGLIKPI